MQKRVLIINGQSIHENNSTSITLKSIISSFDKNNLLEVYYYSIKNFNEKNHINSIQLKLETKWLYCLISKLFTGKVRSEINNKMLSSEMENKTSVFHKLKNFILGLNDYLPINMKCNKHEIELINQFKPDIIYTLGSAIFPLEVSLFFANKYKIPIVLHHMDNWRETKYNESYLPECFKNRLQETLARVEINMKCGMTISEEMAEYYNKLFHKDYIALMNTVPKLDINSPSFTKNEFKLVYAGGLHLNRWKVLLDFERVIKKIAIDGKKITLHVFTKQSDRSKYENMFDTEITQFHDFLPHDQVYKIYEMADILIHMESFEMNINNFIKYSLSTKIPEYMSAGRPIICYAPKEIAVSKYILKSKCGLSASNIDELCYSINLLINDESLRKRMSQNGIKIASEKHSDEYKNQIIEKVFNC